jgi:hypothetical protein
VDADRLGIERGRGRGWIVGSDIILGGLSTGVKPAPLLTSGRTYLGRDSSGVHGSFHSPEVKRPDNI